MKLNDLDGEIFLSILEVIARDMVRKCMRFDREGRLRFVEVLSEYTKLCLVNRQFNVFMGRARVDGKLLKTTLMDLGVTNFGAMLDAGNCHHGLSAHCYSQADIRIVCGPVWKNPRLWNSMAAILKVCEESYSPFQNHMSPTLLSWIPMTFKKQLVENPDAHGRRSIQDLVGRRGGVDDLEFEMGPYRIEILDPEISGYWTGVSLLSYKYGTGEEGRDLGKDMGGYEQGPYWLWRRVGSPHYRIVNYADNEVTSHLGWNRRVYCKTLD
jgi:hypothetical protein